MDKVELNSEIIEGFCASILRKRFDNATKTPQFHRELWDLFCSPDKYVAAAAPRGHAKSTAITHTFTLAVTLFRVSQFTVIVSDTETQSVQFLNDIKMELMDNEDLLAFFPIKKFHKWTENDIVGEFDDGYMFRILAKGSEQSLRGLKWNGMRPKMIICHEEGTQIYTPQTGWINNKDHPRATQIQVNDYYEIEFEDGTIEKVTPEHRYYIEGFGWKEAQNLKKNDFVSENISEDTLNEILRNERKLLKNTTISQKLKNGLKSGLLKIKNSTLRLKGIMPEKIRKRLGNMYKNIENLILASLLFIVLKGEQKRRKRPHVGVTWTKSKQFIGALRNSPVFTAKYSTSIT